jgi:hypothetical protein
MNKVGIRRTGAIERGSARRVDPRMPVPAQHGGLMDEFVAQAQSRAFDKHTAGTRGAGRAEARNLQFRECRAVSRGRLSDAQLASCRAGLIAAERPLVA